MICQIINKNCGSGDHSYVSYDGRMVDKSFVMIMTMIDVELLIGQYLASILAKS